MDFCGLLSYKEITEEQAISGLINLYTTVQENQDTTNSLSKKFWKGANYAPSTFIKFYMGKNKIKAEFYRDDGRGGDYSLKESIIID